MSQPQWNEKERKKGQQEENEGRENKGSGERDGEFQVNAVYGDSCLGATHSLETLTDSSVKRAAPAAMLVFDCVREMYSCTCVTVKVCGAKFVRRINYIFGNTD